MSIEFIRDEFLESKKEELDNINKELSKKVMKTDKNVIFLKRFTLALMGQYKFHKKLFEKKHEEIEMLNKHIIHEFKRPVQRIMPQRLQVPTPPKLNIPTPQMNIPEPILVESKKEEVPIPI